MRSKLSHKNKITYRKYDIPSFFNVLNHNIFTIIVEGDYWYYRRFWDAERYIFIFVYQV